MTRPRSVILGIGGLLGHDANAALLVDGKLIGASQEERFTRAKHDGAFPHRAISDCLEIGGLREADVTDVVFAEKPLQTVFFAESGRPGNWLTRGLGHVLPARIPSLYQAPARVRFPRAQFHFAWHHLSHVAGAFHTSPFSRAAFLCVDGKGEDYSASVGTIDGKTINMPWEQRYENGLGMLYTLVTSFLGFLSFGSEYKVMGLAPYGRARYVTQLGQLYTTDSAGGLRLKSAIRFNWNSLMGGLAEVAKATGIPVRQSADPLTSDHIDLAASLQQIFEDEVLKMARFAREKTGERDLLFCGGCAQNCVTAGKLRDAKIFDHVFNSPVGGDMGSGLGAALLLERERSPDRVEIDPNGFYLGSEPGEIPESAEEFRAAHSGTVFEFVAQQLAAGKVVGWVRGRMELGARALGARSILADPRQPRMQSVLNLKVKFRESFRPFAPAILAEECASWFETDEPSDYMQYTANLVQSRRTAQPEIFENLRERLDFPRCEIPSVVHVDYSARLQTIRAETHPDFHRLLTEFKALTGVPILINTSFNVSGQPIVRTAVEAWECFLNTDIDLLVLNDSVYRNPFLKTREEKLAWLKQFAKSA